MTVARRGLRVKVREKNSGTNNATAPGKVNAVGVLEAGIGMANAIADREGRAMIAAVAVGPIIEADSARIGRIDIKDPSVTYRRVAVMNGLPRMGR
jgi:hypothetical protein